MTYNVDEIKIQMKQVLKHAEKGKDFKVDKLMDKWYKAKSKLIEDFGGNLVIESGKAITVDKPDDDKIIEYIDFIDDIAFITGDEELRSFLMDQGWTAFYANSVRENWYKYGYKIPKGMKISRALRLFIEEPRLLDKWQIKYSMLLQGLRITGELCLSLHPLDYLSISETTHNWRSCHSLDGEYRAGNLSYMLDTVTVVAYLKSTGEHKLPNFPSTVLWNSKKWRMLFYINQDRNLIFSSKPYPFDNPFLVKESYRFLEGIVGSLWPEDYSLYNLDGDVPILEYLDNHSKSLHFNDCLSSATYSPRYKVELGEEMRLCEPIIVGAAIPCLGCEQGHVDFSADYFCVECGDYSTCTTCGEHMFAYEACQLDGQEVCPMCYDDLVEWCSHCDSAYHKENPSLIYVRNDCYCPTCYDILYDENGNLIKEEVDEGVEVCI